ncbi:PHD finger protein [Acorus calamus]|uniref:PHD finger protein n=1 Tax=Acorus calamus TaxID=4465 RepID=A0AAV9EDT2_ACOCL|nr:PHD finger protein [Acorus calamus]
MVVMNGRPMKRAKKRVQADLHDFLRYPESPEEGMSGTFRSNVRLFVSRYGRLLPASPILSGPDAFADLGSTHLQTWRISFRIGEDDPDESVKAATVELEVVEEDVARSRSTYCDQCRVVGWSNHPVCRRRYHFIIRKHRDDTDGYDHPCPSCRSMLHNSDLRCLVCSYEMSTDDVQNWVYLQLEDSTHVLHGVVHSNGFGHLLRVNGREGGSKFLSGFDIMSFWDRLCTVLHVRKASVMDVSKKFGMDYKLLYCMSKGHPWYGNWGYQFGAGSFMVTAEFHRAAVHTLANIPLDLLFSANRGTRMPLQDTIDFYRFISDHPLLVVRDLFSFLLSLLNKKGDSAHKTGKYVLPIMEFPTKLLCMWPWEDIERAEKAIICVLRAIGESRWVSWHLLRGTAFHAASGLIDLLNHCLKGLIWKLIDGGSMVINSRCNLETNTVEFRLEKVHENPGKYALSEVFSQPTRDHVIRDLKLLYDSILNPETMQPFKPEATYALAQKSAAILIDCKQFIKDYESMESPKDPLTIQISCEMELADQPNDFIAPPHELLVLPLTATVADLKTEATKAFQEAYIAYERFQVEQLLDFGKISDDTQMQLLVGMKGMVRVKGRCEGLDDFQMFLMERGVENWIVDCYCGAKDDDGERMLTCDTCGVWRHTRCVGIRDSEEVPPKFVCAKCVIAARRPPPKRGRPCKRIKSGMGLSCNPVPIFCWSSTEFLAEAAV